MASIKFLLAVVFANAMTLVLSQRRTPGFLNVPATGFNRGGRISFQGLSLGQVCKQIMMMGGKEALSDGMGAASKWFSTQKISATQAGGTDPQMQCLFAQATGAMAPGMVGNKDPGNIFGDYFDTIIEYPMVMDPCSAPQCDGQVNPVVLLMRKYGPMMGMRRRGMGGMGGMMGGMMGGALNNRLASPMGGAMGGAMNRMPAPQQPQPQQTPLNMMSGLAALAGGANNNAAAAASQQQQQLNNAMTSGGLSSTQPLNNNNVQQQQQQPGSSSQLSTQLRTPGMQLSSPTQPGLMVPTSSSPTNALSAGSLSGGGALNPGNIIQTIMQNPKLMEMFQQFILNKMMNGGNFGQPNPMAMNFPAVTNMPGMSGVNPMMPSMRPPQGGMNPFMSPFMCE